MRWSQSVTSSFARDPCPEAFEAAELRVRETMNALACESFWAPSSRSGTTAASRIERAELVPGRGDGEDDHDLARSADIPASALPQRRERGIAGAGRREPGPRPRLPDAAGMNAVGEHPAAPDTDHARALGDPRPRDAGQHP